MTMPDDGVPDAPDAAPENARRAPEGGAFRNWLAQNRALTLGLGCLGLCGIIALDLYFMMRGSSKPSLPALAVSASPSPAAKITTQAESNAPIAVPSAEASTPSVDFESDNSEPNGKKLPRKQYATVQQAAVESCTTASVDGLSRQIIEQARCLQPNAFMPLPSRPNLILAPQVFGYMAPKARTQLLKALNANPKKQMTINSALRTVAQQYLVWRWSATKRCGVPLATPPGESNHETGTAVDIAEAATWRAALEAREFKWLGATDPVHFDFKSRSSPPRSASDVLAFQKLWNRNHPTQKLSEDGRYAAATEQRLKQSPPDGFALGPSCSGRSSTSR